VSLPDWLPPLVRLDDYGGDWERYEEALYEAFRADFTNSQCYLGSQRVAYRKRPPVRGRANTFWHLISTGLPGKARTRDRSRCERIRWPRALIDAYPGPNVKAWRVQRGGDTNLAIAPGDFSYVVILQQRRGYVLLVTAYPVEWERRRRQMERQWDKSNRGHTKS